MLLAMRTAAANSACRQASDVANDLCNRKARITFAHTLNNRADADTAHAIMQAPDAPHDAFARESAGAAATRRNEALRAQLRQRNERSERERRARLERMVEMRRAANSAGATNENGAARLPRPDGGNASAPNRSCRY